MMNKNIFVAVALGAGALWTSIAHAQIPVPIRPAYSYPVAPSSATGPASVQMGGTPLFVTPYLGVAAGYDDNLFLSNGNEKSSSIYVVSPGIRVDARDASKVFQFSYQSQIGRYTQSADDDYVDHNVMTMLDMAVAPSTYMRLGYTYLRNHDPRGSTDRAISTQPDRYRLSSPEITVAYGAPGAQGRVEAYYSDATRRYLNNRAVTIQSDRNTTEFGGAFYWRVMPKTNVLVDVRRTYQSYILASSPFDSTEDRVYGGVSWDATAQTTGTIKVGSLKKQFNSDLPSFSTTGYEGLITWLPRTYSRFDFYASRFPQESTGLGRFILSDAVGVLWTHGWNSVLSTGLNARFQKDKYQGFDRNDDLMIVGARVGYRFRRWLTLGAEYTHTKRDSNTNSFDYDKNLYLLTATASM